MVSRILSLSLVFFLFLSCVNHDLNKKYDCTKSDLTLTLDSVSFATSCSISDGSIYVACKGGVEPYTFSVNSKPEQSSSIFTGLSSGVYSAVVTDGNGCKISLDNIVVAAHGFKFSTLVTEDNQCTTDNGSITIDVQEGNGPFTYKVGQSNFSNNNVFSGLASGQYAVVIRDATLCTVQLNITVPRGNTGVHWAADILPIMKKSCAINGCHDGSSRSDYSLYTNVQKNLLQVKSTTKNKTMPFDGTALPQNQIDLIGCWVDDGGLNN